MKKCTKCHVPKEKSEFYGKHSECKGCFKFRIKKNRQEHPEKIREARKKYADTHQAQVRAGKRKWRLNNPGKCRASFKKHYRTHPQTQLATNLRGRVRSALKSQHAEKSMNTMDLIGCSIEFLEKHLESMFDKDMTWNNHGTYWHIDHIIPCAKFDLSREAEQRKCFHWTNLQPLEARKNLQKWAK